MTDNPKPRRVLTREEAAQLRRKNITSVDQLWNAIGDDFNPGVNKIIWDTGVSRDQLRSLLAANSGREAELADGRWRTALWLWVRRLDPRPVWLESTIICLVLVVLLLLLRTSGIGSLPPAPVGLGTQVMVAKRHLKAGELLRSSDVDTARLVRAGNYIQAGAPPGDWFLTRDVLWGKPLRFEDVTRQQVTTTKEIQANAIITPSDVTLTWSPYHPNAYVTVQQVVKCRTAHVIPGGKLILPELLQSGCVGEQPLPEQSPAAGR